MSLSKPLTQTFDHERSIVIFDSTKTYPPHSPSGPELSSTEILDHLPRIASGVWIYNNSNISYTNIDINDLTVSTLGYARVLYLDHEGKGTYQIVRPTDTCVQMTDDFIYWTQIQDLEKMGVKIFYFDSEVRK